MDFERLKRGMAEIVTITESVPEQFKDKCFDVLLNALLNEAAPTKPPVEKKPALDIEKPPAEQTPPAAANNVVGALPPLKGQMRLFMQRTNISNATLAKVVSYVDDQVNFVHEPKPANLSAGQIDWSLLSALENAINNNAFTVDGNAVKKLCDDKGFLDSKNFWANFGRNTNLFTKPLTSAEPRQLLSTEGQAELAKLIESLATR